MRGRSTVRARPGRGLGG